MIAIKKIVRRFFFETARHVKLYAEQWMPSGRDAVGIVQIAHGMRESTAYYTEFCETLVAAGYGVYLNDALGHGRTAGAAGSADFDKKAGDCGPDAIHGMAADLSDLTDLIKAENPELPVFLLGHSMGSVISRVYAYQFGGKLDGLIFSGTTGPAKQVEFQFLLTAAKIEADARGISAPAVDTPKLMFSHYNDRFPKTKTGFEYMSRDENMVRQAIASPYSKVPYRCGFYIDFLTAILELDTDAHIDAIPKSLPIFSVSGDMDPFGDYGRGVPLLFETYRAHGIEDTDYHLYQGGRHEMLREINRPEVFDEIIGWLIRHTNMADQRQSMHPYAGRR